jgi:hypothetical protein
MDLRDIVLNFLTYNEKGMQQFITLNDVMNEGVAQQAGVRDMPDLPRGERTGMDTSSDPSRPGSKNAVC